MENNRLRDLLQQHIEGTLSSEDSLEMDALIARPGVKADLSGLLSKLMEESSLRLTAEDPEWKIRVAQILETDSTKEILIPAHRVNTSPGALRHPLFKSGNILQRGFLKYAAAILLLIGSGAYFYYSKENRTEVVVKPSPVLEDIMPAKEKAILTLSDGQEIVLDSTAQKIITEGSLQIQNQDNGLVYGSTDLVVNNTMTTPRGGQYKLTLADGTRVWLNAASSITFPTAFKGGTREVSVTGEAYFEVNTNKEKPFIVNAGGRNITVLGTSFNVNAYSDEPQFKTSLLDGAVKVGNDILHPGEAWTNGKITKTSLEQDLAWKNGLFNFRNTDIKAITRQLEKWYDIEFIYPMNIDEQLNAKISRQTPLSEILQLLELTNIVHFRVEGKKVIVTK